MSFQRRHSKGKRKIDGRLIVGVLAFLLLGTVSVSSFVMVQNAHAMADCGILFPCQTPTPMPSPSPTQVPTPTPPPRPTAPPVTPTAIASPTATVTASPTATVPVITPTPGASPTRVPAATGGNSEHQPPDQGTGSNLLSGVGAGIVIPLILLIGLGIGSFALRHTFKETKLPPSGARPWSRTRVPDPASLGGLETQPQVSTISSVVSPAFEKGLLTNATYYTKLPGQRPSDSWEYE